MSSLMQYYPTRLIQAGFSIVNLISDVSYNIISPFLKKFYKKIIIVSNIITSENLFQMAPGLVFAWGTPPGLFLIKIY